MTYFFFAMQREADMIDLPNKHVIGIGATDMPKTTDEDIIINIGYCGGYKIPVGAIIEPKGAIDVKAGRVAEIDSTFNCERAHCFTSDEFVTEPFVNLPSIYEMELYKISKAPHKRLHALKIVSDNLCEEDCENYNDAKAWAEVKRILEGYVNP